MAPLATQRTRVLYTDVDGTLTWRGGLMLSDSTRIFEALIAARKAGLTIVPVSGRGRVQVREFSRLFGFERGIGELGCLHVDKGDPHWEFGDFPVDEYATNGEELSPVEVMHERGLLDLVMKLGDVEEHEPWNEGRRATLLVRGNIDVESAEAELANNDFGWCQIMDNGLTRNNQRVYHLIPRGAGKRFGVSRDRERHGLAKEECVFIGDSRADMSCADEVRECWMVANGDASLEWPHRTEAENADGVAELIYRLIG